MRADITAADEWFIGEDAAFSYTLVDKDNPNLAVDVTGWTIRFMLSADESGDALFTIPVTIVDGPEGELAWTATQANTIGLIGDQEYWYTLRRIDSGASEEITGGSVQLLDVFVNYAP